MATLEELKEQWGKNRKTGDRIYDKDSFAKIIKSRVKKHTNASMKYFWASFSLQILVYALLSHVIVKYWYNSLTVVLSVAGILLYVPFTILLMKKFKEMAVTKLIDHTSSSIQQYVSRYHNLLQSFYRFKRRYELFLIPLSSIIGVWLVFTLYVPGGVMANASGAVTTFAITLLSCVAAIWSENRKSFKEPIRQLRQVLDEFKGEE